MLVHNVAPLRPTVGSRHVAGLVIALPTVVALATGSALGVGLGWWCRAFAASRSVNGVLADLGAPWIVAAFAAGALVGRLSAGDSAPNGLVRLLRLAAFVGGVAGATCLVVATIVYYGPARTGSLDVRGAGSATLVWSAIGIGVGTVFGALGAVWRAAPSLSARLACLVVLGTAVASEAYFLLDIGAAGNETLVRNVLAAVAIVGVTVPVLLGIRWRTIAGIALVAILAIPGSLAAEVFSRVATGSIWLLRTSV